MFGAQSQRTLVAPALRKSSTTCRQASRYSPGVLPLTSAAHGDQFPFISGAYRMTTRSPYSTMVSAMPRNSASRLPAMIAASDQDF
ncbi:hypothetical protein BG844_08405 [Couchioplanes caeruleus subsp. caeruleus]|uniref:Uncharacterized protein n=1 Tax=Couchioplanes caeruleus subsp. caeruleus TaxID=56427 RepID=A0A1K0GQG8_9ACTN|nr:hypothetical protein BG844_08405 [Couchioplanes caeruleus subsp. caeruleus]